MIELNKGHYSVWSTGHDGKRDARWVRGGTADPEADLVYSDGAFFQFPVRGRSVIFNPDAWAVPSGEPQPFPPSNGTARVELTGT